MRIVSFLPAATEMICALGLEDSLVGISHECDYPASVRGKPVLIKPVLDTARMTQAEIDTEVSRRFREGKLLYDLDLDCLRRLAPDLILAQDLCQVCGPAGNEATRALAALAPGAKVVYLTPHSLEEVLGNILDVGRAVDRDDRAVQFVADLRTRMAAIAAATAASGSRPRTFVMEWFDPPYNAGHWTGELVRAAGGEDRLASDHGYSVRIPWERVRDYAPEVLVLAPCGYNLPEAVGQAAALPALPGWSDLPAVKAGRVYAVNASQYFARPGPRLVEGIGILAKILHPAATTERPPADGFVRMEARGRALAAVG